MDAIYGDNPARNLHDRLTAMRIGEDGQNRPGATPLIEAFKASLGNGGEVGRGMVAFYGLPAEIRRELATYGDTGGVQNSAEPVLHRIENAVAVVPPGASIDDYWRAIEGDNALQVLGLVAYVIDQQRTKRHTPTVIIRDVNGVRARLSQLLVDVTTADDLTEDERRIISHGLLDLLDALNGLGVRTTQSFLERIEVFSGRLANIKDNVERIAKSKTLAAVVAFVLGTGMQSGIQMPSTLQLPPGVGPSTEIVVCYDRPAWMPPLELPTPANGLPAGSEVVVVQPAPLPPGEQP